MAERASSSGLNLKTVVIAIIIDSVASKGVYLGMRIL